MPIKILDPEVVAKIAAGEVVERPASVVKELVENSLDAGATQISVEVRGGGLSMIRVMDNGVGIPSGEAELAFQRYATSKVNQFEDLNSIGSLGFRGEALPSIVAVAQVDMVTCAEGESAGAYLSVRDDEVIDRRSQGRSQGTTITVRSLFRRVPARLKFLKSPATENSHMADVVGHYALAFPEVKFSLFIDGRTVLRTPGSGRLVDSIAEVYGLEVARNMLEIGDEGWEGGAVASPPEITGMVGLPTIARSSRGYLSFFVNRRWISSRALAWAVEEAYHGLLMQGKYPVAVIDISMSPDQLDVNIHPTKREVKFQNERAVFGAVQKSVRRALIGHMPVPRIEEAVATYVSPSQPRQISWKPTGSDAGSASALPLAPQIPSMALPVLRVLGQLSSSYIVAEGPDGLYLIDQHAAHERILFERVTEQRSRRATEVQGLLEPIVFEVEPKRSEIMQQYWGRLAEFGFSIEPFGDRTYLVRAVPALLHDRDWAGVLRELLDSLSGGVGSDWEESVAVSIACHGAVRAGQNLADDEMRELVRQLEQTTIPHTCPHGRPTLICLSEAQLRRDFGRS